MQTYPSIIIWFQFVAIPVALCLLPHCHDISKGSTIGHIKSHWVTFGNKTATHESTAWIKAFLLEWMSLLYLMKTDLVKIILIFSYLQWRKQKNKNPFRRCVEIIQALTLSGFHCILFHIELGSLNGAKHRLT